MVVDQGSKFICNSYLYFPPLKKHIFPLLWHKFGSFFHVSLFFIFEIPFRTPFPPPPPPLEKSCERHS